jgi:hypothetical protein
MGHELPLRRLGVAAGVPPIADLLQGSSRQHLPATQRELLEIGKRDEIHVGGFSRPAARPHIVENFATPPAAVAEGPFA